MCQTWSVKGTKNLGCRYSNRENQKEEVSHEQLRHNHAMHSACDSYGPDPLSVPMVSMDGINKRRGAKAASAVSPFVVGWQQKKLASCFYKRGMGNPFHACLPLLNLKMFHSAYFNSLRAHPQITWWFMQRETLSEAITREIPSSSYCRMSP